jgi:putative transposase
VSEKYAFIATKSATNENAPTIVAMCAWLAVSKSGFYDWCGRPASAAAQRREELKIKINTLLDLSGGTYGYRRIHAELIRAGERVGAELVRKLMRELNLVPVQPKPYKRTTIQGEGDPAVADLVARDFTAARPGAKLVGDITFIPTWEGWLFLATVIDCFNKEVIGWSMAEHLRTELVTDALAMAARNHVLEPDAVMHSDRSTRRPNMSPNSTSSGCGIRWAGPQFVGTMRSRNRFSRV